MHRFLVKIGVLLTQFINSGIGIPTFLAALRHSHFATNLKLVTIGSPFWDYLDLGANFDRLLKFLLLFVIHFLSPCLSHVLHLGSLLLRGLCSLIDLHLSFFYYNLIEKFIILKERTNHLTCCQDISLTSLLEYTYIKWTQTITSSKANWMPKTLSNRLDC